MKYPPVFPMLFLALAALTSGVPSLGAAEGSAAPDTASGDGAPAAQHPFDRYLPLVQRAPFGPGSAAEPERSFADSYYLASTARIGGERIAVIVDRMTNTRIHLSDSQPAHGIRLVSVEQGDTFKATRVILEKNGERGAVTYDLGMLGQGAPPPGTPPMAQQGVPQPGQPAPQPGQPVIQPGSAPGAPPVPSRTMRRRLIVPKQP